MIRTFAELERARLPAAAMGRLAALRCEEGLEIALHDRDLWVRWAPGDDAVALSLLPLPGCRLYGQRDGHWHAWGEALPAFDVPVSLRFRPLAQVIFPAAVQPIAAETFAPVTARMTLVEDGEFRPTTAMQCPLRPFWTWADTVPPCRLSCLRGAVHRDQLFLLGKNLPWLDAAERFWGQAVLAPIGRRPQPCLSESDLRRAAGVADSDLFVLRSDRCDIIAQDLFASLSHAALRLAMQEARP